MDNVYLIHGFMGISKDHFEKQIEVWRRDYNVIPLNLPGHGDNLCRASEPFFQSVLSWVCDQIQMNGKGRIVGLSLGASIAIHLAIEHPELCESIVLTGYSPCIPEAMTTLMEQQYEMFIHIENSNPELARNFRALHGERWHETLRIVLTDMTFNYPTVTDEKIQSLTVPTLVLNGAKERHERNAACKMANLNECIQIGIITGAGHAANMEQPGIYNSLVKIFWE